MPTSPRPGTPRPLDLTSRAAAARSRRRSAAAPAGAATKDPCPGCGTDLAQAHGATRRVAVFSPRRGLFLWRCPECGHGWAEAASSQCGSTTRSAPPVPSSAPPAA